MNSLIIGQRYEIIRKHNGDTKPPMPYESLVEIVDYNRKGSGFVTIKYITGPVQKINKIETIKYDNYDFVYKGDEYAQLQDEFIRFKTIESEVQKNLEEYKIMRDDIHKNIKRYKELEWEVLFLRAAFIIMIWMYIKGVIKFV
jgi:hypothetical protein